MKLFSFSVVFFALAFLTFQNSVTQDKVAPLLIVLGTVQDAGSPHIACTKQCCRELFSNPDKNRQVVSLGLIDIENEKNYIFDATPDFATQVKELKKHSPFNIGEIPAGIFLTHAHIGHYTGLMYLGREAMAAENAALYAMPKMKSFLEKNGPWSQLVNIGNVTIREIQNEQEVILTPSISVTPFIVPHRDEYSETVGYKILGPNRSALFIPDIDKWLKWDKDIIEEIEHVDYAFIDATFFDGEEINNRDISEIPHPFIIESMELFKDLTDKEKKKVYFIHFNHTNPVLDISSKQAQKVKSSGFNIAQIYDVFNL